MPGMKSLPLPDVQPLLKRLPLKYAAIVAIGVTTGCRISEILALRREDLLTPEGRLKDRIAFLRLKTGTGKKKTSGKAKAPAPVKHRFIGIPADYRPFVFWHLVAEGKRGYEQPKDFVFRGQSGHHLSRHSVYHVFRMILGPGYGTHWMRKTFAQNLFSYYLKRNAADPVRALELTRRALAHERIDTTVRYLGIMESSLESAQNDIFTIPKKESAHA